MFFESILGNSDFEYNDSLPLDVIDPNPDQPRREVTEDAVQDIVDSLNAENGRIWQPIIVLPEDSEGRYKIIAGGRRYLASKLVGKESIPALISNSADITDGSKVAFTIAMLENVTRNDLSLFDEGAGYKHLKDTFKLSNKEIASTYGKSASYISEAIIVSETRDDNKLAFIADLVRNGETRDLSMLSKLVRLAKKNTDGCRQLVQEALKNGNLTRKWVTSLTGVNLEQDLDEVLENLEARTEAESRNTSDNTSARSTITQESDSKDDHSAASHENGSHDDAMNVEGSVKEKLESETNKEKSGDDADKESHKYRTRPLSKAVVSITYQNNIGYLLLDRVDPEEGYVWIHSNGGDLRVSVDDVSLLNIG